MCDVTCTTAGDAVVMATITALDKMPTCCVVDCENRTSSGVKFFRIPAGSHPFKKIDDICDCKLLNGQTGTILRSKRLVLVALTSYQETLKSSFIIPFCLLKLESLDCMNSFLYVKLCNGPVSCYRRSQLLVVSRRLAPTLCQQR